MQRPKIYLTLRPYIYEFMKKHSEKTNVSMSMLTNHALEQHFNIERPKEITKPLHTHPIKHMRWKKERKEIKEIMKKGGF